MKRQGGFTLIELVVVIVILGILAVTAAPRFLNLQGDARKSSLQGLKGAMDGAAGIVYGKAAIEGKEASDTNVNVDDIQTIYGYPTASSAGIAQAVVGLSSDWDTVSSSVGLTGIGYTFKGQDTTGYSSSTGCYVEYQQATSSSVYTINLQDDKC
ncbi:prepilin-type N-terminal cleavage/methylation domain-containing protein [Vibrio mexicanus]|uniref:prepilin-type N-terminal cleavage/methylation domain-containing protein n=1 Tax=Vibrio mexicanus TaxID=1004326 RepID=UPI00063C2524|nr:prepilin-type N-terminal cleavage/methylation domain-containing protein [Vibrio mexicanus]